MECYVERKRNQLLFDTVAAETYFYALVKTHRPVHHKELILLYTEFLKLDQNVKETHDKTEKWLSLYYKWMK